MREEDLRKKAKKRIEAKKGFYAHLGSYVGTILFLFIINFMTSPQHWWFIYPATGWGIGLLGHYFGVFGFFGMQGPDWEEKALQKEMKRLREQNLASEFEADNTPDLEDDHLELKEKVRQQRDYDDQELV